MAIFQGSFNTRMGWSSSTEGPDLVYKPLIAKTRREKGKLESELLVGNSIPNLEAVRVNLRTPFDRNVVTQVVLIG